MPAATARFGAVEEHGVYGKGKYLFQGSIRHMHVHNSSQKPGSSSCSNQYCSTFHSLSCCSPRYPLCYQDVLDGSVIQWPVTALKACSISFWVCGSLSSSLFTCAFLNYHSLLSFSPPQRYITNYAALILVLTQKINRKNKRGGKQLAEAHFMLKQLRINTRGSPTQQCIMHPLYFLSLEGLQQHTVEHLKKKNITFT